nr:TraG/TraD/VirD4 family protein [uncultured Clostridium sp.]
MRFNLFVQSFSQLNEKYGDNTAQNILDNCYVWNYLKTSNETTAEKISKKIGTYTTTSWSESSDKKSNNGGSNSMNLISRALLTPDEILRLQRPFLLVMCSGTEPAITNAPDLSKWTFNELLGLGNKDWNIKVREKRENARELKEIRPLELWDIDKQIMDLKQMKKERELEERRLNFMKRQGVIDYPKGNL